MRSSGPLSLSSLEEAPTPIPELSEFLSVRHIMDLAHPLHSQHSTPPLVGSPYTRCTTSTLSRALRSSSSPLTLEARLPGTHLPLEETIPLLACSPQEPGTTQTSSMLVELPTHRWSNWTPSECTSPARLSSATLAIRAPPGDPKPNGRTVRPTTPSA